MTGQELTINILLGLIVNIATAFITYWWTTHRDKREHAMETRLANAKIADIAVSHLYTSYMQSKRLKTDVLGHVGDVKSGSVSSDVFATILDGIARSLEQERVSIVPNIMSWKAFVLEGSLSEQLIAKVQEQDFYMPQSSKAVSLVSDTARPTSSIDSNSMVAAVGQNVQKPATPTHAVPEKVANLGPLDIQRLAGMMRNPTESAFRAFMSGDVAQLRAVRGNIDLLKGRSEKVAVGSMLAITGDVAGAELLRDALSEGWSEMDIDEFCVALGGIVAAAERNDTEKEEIQFIEPIARRRLEQSNDTNEKRAWIHNQLQKLYWAIGDYAKAISILETVVALDGSNPSYWHNLALCYEKIEDFGQAEGAVRKVLELDSNDPQHLGLAIRVLTRQGYEAEAQALASRLAQIDPFQAMLTGAVKQIKKKDAGAS